MTSKEFVLRDTSNAVAIDEEEEGWSIIAGAGIFKEVLAFGEESEDKAWEAAKQFIIDNPTDNDDNEEFDEEDEEED